MTIALTVPDAQAARLAAILRDRGATGANDQAVITDFLTRLLQQEVRAVRVKVLEEQYEAQKAASAPDATLADTLLQLQRLRET